MTSDQFIYWLQGFFEISNEKDQNLSAQQVQIIKDHLALAFKKETPIYTTAKSFSTTPIYDGLVEKKDDYSFTINNPITISKTFENLNFIPGCSC